MAKKILVVEDDPDIRALMMSRLEANGFETIEAEDGVEGLAKYISVRPDLMILDAMMPRMGGHEVLEAIRKKRAAGEDIAPAPVIILTARADTQTAADALKEKVAAVLLKPFNPEELLGKIRELCP